MIYDEMLFIIGAYLLGSISGSSLISKLMHLPDPREFGSHNPGATNMLRTNGKLAGLLVLLFDMTKGMIPVYVAYRFDINSFALGLIAISVCLGHIFPCFHKFKGGKGVATALGTLILISWSSSIFIVLSWLIALLLTGFSSVAAVVMSLVAPFFVWKIRPEFTMPVAMLSCLIILRHISNLTRLLNHNESKIYQRKKNKSYPLPNEE